LTVGQNTEKNVERRSRLFSGVDMQTHWVNKVPLPLCGPCTTGQQDILAACELRVYTTDTSHVTNKATMATLVVTCTTGCYYSN